MSRTANSEQSEAEPGWSEARDQLFRMIMEGRSFSGRERNCCFLNTGQGRFATISAVSGMDFPDDGRCIAVTDWDRDGDLDMWIANRNAPRLRFLRNDTPSHNHYIALQLVGNGTTTNRDAVGARVEVIVDGRGSRVEGQRGGEPRAKGGGPEEVEGRGSRVEESGRDSAIGPDSSALRLIKTLRAGEGFLSQSSKWLHFGLGTATDVDRVVVHWPGGDTQTFFGLDVDRRYRLVQEQVAPEPVASREMAAAIHAAAPTLPAESRVARVPLITRVPMPAIRYSSPEGTAVMEMFESGTPTLINLWASWCQGCVEELSGFTSRQLELEGMRIVSLSVDQLGEQPTPGEKVSEFLRRMNYPHAWGHVDAEQVELLQQLHDQFFFLKKPLPLPSSFLVDGQGRLAVIYRGPVTVDQLLKDVRRSADGAVRGSPDPAQPVSVDPPLDDVRRSADDYRETFLQAACFPGRSLDHPRVHAVAQRADLQTRYYVAAWLESTGRYLDALKHFGQLAERDPSWAVPQRHLAKLYLARNQLSTAAAFAARALKLAPNDAHAQHTMGLVLSEQGDQRGAESHFRRAIELKDDFAEAHNNLGTILASRGTIEAAIRCFERAVQIDDRFAEAHTNLGSAYVVQNDVLRATKHYRRAIEVDPKYADAYNNLGTLLARQGDLEQAIRYYRQALSLDPSNQETRKNLERALSVRKTQEAGTRPD